MCAKATKSVSSKIKYADEPIEAKVIRDFLPSPDLMDIQARALEEGIPYQTFIASVLHKYASGRLVEKPSSLNRRSTRPARKRAAG